MKNITYILFILSVLILSCEKNKSTSNNTSTTTTGGTTTGNPTNDNGKLIITILHPQKDCPPQTYAVSHVVGIATNSNDLTNEAYLKAGTGTKSGQSYTFTVPAGLYYYKGKACCTNCNSQGCTSWGGFTGTGTCISKSGSTQVTAGQSVSKTISLL